MQLNFCASASRRAVVRCLLVLSLCSNAACFAQLTADAGADRVWCISSLNGRANPPRIGGTPAARNGTPPYTYEWYELNFWHHAVDSFATSNPTLEPNAKNSYYSGVDTARLVLRVTDAASAVAYDTVNVVLSQWICPMAHCSLAKQPADTISMQWQYSCSSRFPPYTPFKFRYWTPSTYLSDSTDQHARCWAPVPTEYNVVSVDGLGCISVSRCEVWFPKSSAASELKPGEEVVITPNPLSQSMLKRTRDWIGGILTIAAADGRIVSRHVVTTENTSLPWTSADRSGVYFYRITSVSGKVRAGKLIMQ